MRHFENVKGHFICKIKIVRIWYASESKRGSKGTWNFTVHCFSGFE